MISSIKSFGQPAYAYGSYVKYGGDHAVIVSKTGVIQDGHHRVANAIKNGKVIDIYVEPYK